MQGICAWCQSKAPVNPHTGLISLHEAFGKECHGEGSIPQIVLKDEKTTKKETK